MVAHFTSVLMFSAYAASVATATKEDTISSQSYLLTLNGEFNRRVEEAINAAGGSVKTFLPQIGVAVVESNNPNFDGDVTGLGDVIMDYYVTGPETRVAEEVVSIESLPQPPFTGDDDFFFDLQWGHTAVRAQEAWAAGQTGQGVRVFILDSGFDLDHPDLAPNFNLELSTSFVPGTDDAQYVLPDTFSHGSHVAGTIGAADNGFGIVGVAPGVEMVPVKVIDETLGFGLLSWIIQGILYAADSGADVINMSLGGHFYQGHGYTSKQIAELRVMVNKAITYAKNQGATVIVAAGNDNFDLNDPSTASLVHFMSFASHAVSISAVGPEGWAQDPLTDLTNQAYYTNTGPEIDFAAPGGTIDFDLYDSGELCTVNFVTVPCFVFDFVFSTGNGGWYWSIGTSMAAPHAAGIAAIIIGENGGDMEPAQVVAEMRERALDLGKRGGDDLYGHGLVQSGYGA